MAKTLEHIANEGMTFVNAVSNSLFLTVVWV